MPKTQDTSPAALERLVNGYQVSQAIYVAVTLGIPDRLAGGSLAADELAAAAGTDDRSLYRLLRALASVGVLSEEAGRRFALTELGQGLRSDGGAIAGWAAVVGRPYHWQAWEHFIDSVRTGETGMKLATGTDVWEYRRQHPEETAIFDRAMTGLSRQVGEWVVDAFDFSRFRCLVDVGGGQGAFLAAMLTRYPDLTGILFDQPHVVATAGPVLAAGGVDGRCRVVGGSFFDSVPAGGDAYILKSVIHDWPDSESIAILRSCRAAMPEDSALLLVERTLDPPNAGRETKFADLMMLVAAGGQERTVAEYGALMAAAGFTATGLTPIADGWAVYEGTAA